MTVESAAPVVDAHAHVWRAAPDYPDPGATIVSPVSDVPVALLEEYMDEHEVDRAVLVQPICAGADNSYVAQLAQTNPHRFAAVCAIDSASPTSTEDLEAWSKRGCRGVRVRPLNPGESDVLDRPSNRSLWECAEKHRLVVSLFAGVGHLVAIRKLARAFPRVPIVIDHMGHPSPARQGQRSDWRELLELAQEPQVFIKVSGYHYFSAEPYPYRDTLALVRALREAFGARRLLWGSDFPHVLLRCGYRRSRLLPQRLFDFLDSGELAEVMGGTASRLYWPVPVVST
jgi:predicted TIM-barrel fold metal-dependent hydrolase